MKNYVITGATGNIGKGIATILLSQGANVKVISRSADKVKELTDKGAQAAIGDVNDANFVKHAFEGADAVFCLIPPNMHSNDFRTEQKKVAANYAHAVKANHIKHAVLLSSIGAHLRNGAGIVDGLGDMEELFLDLKDVNVLNLRPSYFMENTFGLIGIIKQMGVAGGPIKGDLKFPVVATKDIAAVAAKRLSELNFKGNTVEFVLGQRDLNYNEIASIAGKAIGKPELKYVQFPYEDAVKGMVGMGFCSENVADAMMNLSKALNEGSALNVHTRTAENTTPTSYEEFAHVFAHVYNM